MTTRVNAAVTSDNPEHIARSFETLSRAAVGLGLEGIEVQLWIAPEPDDPPTTDDSDDG